MPSQMSAIQSQISALSSQVSSMTPKLDVLVTHSTTLVTSTVSTTNRNWHLDGNSRRQRKLKNKVVYKLQLPSWLHSRAYELVYTHSTNIWTTQFRVYNTVPADSPFLLACSSGDYEAVREIIAVDPAHVFDQNERGETALHVGLCFTQICLHVFSADLLVCCTRSHQIECRGSRKTTDRERRRRLSTE